MNKDLQASVDAISKKSGNDFTIDLETIDKHDILILHCFGILDTYDSDNFLECFKVCVEHYRYFILDFSNLKYMSSTGISALVDIFKMTVSKNGNIAIYNCSPRVMELFTLLGFAQFFNVVNSKEDAITLVLTHKVEKKESIFPKTDKCIVCSKSLRIPKSGKFRCSNCKTILVISENGEISL